MRKENDYSRFLFRATGPRNGEKVTLLGIVDNLCGELERLHAVMGLLDYAVANPVPPGTSELLRDFWERASWLLDLWEAPKRRREP